MHRRTSVLLALGGWLVFGPAFASAQNRPAGGPPPPPPPGEVATLPPDGRAGGALFGLGSASHAEFADGFVAFRQRESEDSGLGPIFNDVSCISCHSDPAPGGGSRRVVTRFGRSSGGVFDPLESRGGTLLQNRALDPSYREVIPRDANVVARRVTTPLFGAGLIEAVTDATLRAAAAAPQPDGVSGRVSVLRDVTTGEERVGRFGWKAQHATLLGFSADAYVNEMGITNRFFRADNAPNGDLARLDRADHVLDPEDDINPATGKADVDRVTVYMRLLAPPPRTGPTGLAAVRAGQATFAGLNCTACHTPALQTGPSPVAALANRRVELYSDLLLHDMGALGDGIAQGSATPREMRTAPLWGLGRRNFYLHDGRADTLDEAIRAHDGEARPARERYQALAPAKRDELIAFLRSL